jgi:hypothetical protein
MHVGCGLLAPTIMGMANSTHLGARLRKPIDSPTKFLSGQYPKV